MVLKKKNRKNNIYYWKASLDNPEPIVDKSYISDTVIVSNKKLIQKIEKLRELTISYCVLLEIDGISTSKILDEIYKIINSIKNIQYTEFVAFWKSLDMSYSVFNTSIEQKSILEELINKYCKRRIKLYNKLGYSNITIQALYDSGSSRRNSVLGIKKLISILEEKLDKIPHIKELENIMECQKGYFLPDTGDKSLFLKLCEEIKIKYEFGKYHQGKLPDMVLKLKNQYFIIEAKHIKESGGAQDKQIVETIEFIGYSEENANIKYISFMDGVYFNNFISINNDNNKVRKQKDAIENHLNSNKNNFFVNTFGLKLLIQDFS